MLNGYRDKIKVPVKRKRLDTLFIITGSYKFWVEFNALTRRKVRLPYPRHRIEI